MRITVWTTCFLLSALGWAESVRLDRETVRRFADVTKDICRGYLELFDPVAGVRVLRARAHEAHNRRAFAFEDDLIRTSTSPEIIPAHPVGPELSKIARHENLNFRILANHRRLYVEGQGLRHLPRGSAVLIDPDTAQIRWVFDPGK